MSCQEKITGGLAERLANNCPRHVITKYRADRRLALLRREASKQAATTLDQSAASTDGAERGELR